MKALVIEPYECTIPRRRFDLLNWRRLPIEPGPAPLVGPATTYAYDQTGNRTTGTVIGANNRLLDDGTYTYQYDDDGNRTRRTDKATGEYLVYVWDHRNRMTAVEFRDATGALTRVIEYRYDAFDRLIARLDNADGAGAFEDEEYYVHDSAHGKGGLDDIVLTYDENGNVEHRYLHGPGVDQLFADESFVDGLLWALSDQQGSVKDWADYDEATDTTSVYNHVEYDSFGNVLTRSNSAHEITVGYTGRYIDPDTGLQWNRARWFDPATGRWLGEDPIGFAGGDANLTRYVGNSPTNWVDPSGLRVFPVPLPRWGRFLPRTGSGGARTGVREGVPTIGDVLQNTVFNPDLFGKPSDYYNPVNTPGLGGPFLNSGTESCIGQPAPPAVPTNFDFYLNPPRVNDRATGPTPNELTPEQARAGCEIVKSTFQDQNDSPETKQRSRYRIGDRKTYNTRKKAYEAAKQEGKGAEPVNHPHGPHGPHFHPGDGKGKPLNHNHHYYPKHAR